MRCCTRALAERRGRARIYVVTSGHAERPKRSGGRRERGVAGGTVGTARCSPTVAGTGVDADVSGGPARRAVGPRRSSGKRCRRHAAHTERTPVRRAPSPSGTGDEPSTTYRAAASFRRDDDHGPTDHDHDGRAADGAVRNTVVDELQQLDDFVDDDLRGRRARDDITVSTRGLTGLATFTMDRACH